MRTSAPAITVEEYRLLPETGPRYQLITIDLFDLARDVEVPAHRITASERFTSDVLPGLEIDAAEVFSW